MNLKTEALINTVSELTMELAQEKMLKNEALLEVERQKSENIQLTKELNTYKEGTENEA